MMNHWISQLPPQGMWIGVGLLVAAAVSVLLATRLRLGRLDTLSLFSACVLAGGVGSRIAWILLSPTLAIGEFLSNPLTILDPLRGGYSSFGAILGGCFVLGVWCMLSRRAANKSESSSDALSHSLQTLDVLVLAGLSGLGFARIGCLANGCDFGRVTEGAWALHYPPGTEAYAQHLMTQQIAWNAPSSLGVYPFALFLALGIFGIVLVSATLLWKRTMRPGRIAGWSGVAYLLWRFLVEWTRDPSTVLAIWGGFNIHHSFAIIGALACGSLLVFEARPRAARRQF